MRRPLAAASALAIFLVAGAVMVGMQFAPAADASAAASDSLTSNADSDAGGSAGTAGQAVMAAAQDDGDDRPNDADMMFATMMIPHHQQAVELARILAGTAGIDDISIALAAFIDRDQSREIVDMQAWLDAWHRTGIMDHDADGTMAGMAGMATAEQIAALDAANGTDAERMFLDLMIVHHEGALQMTREALAGGNNSYIRALAKHVAAEQEREIAAMTVRRDSL